MKKNNSYIAISFVVLLFGIYFIPKIVNRIKNDNVVKANRLNRVEKKSKKSDLLKFEKVPNFQFTNQNNEVITNANYKGKVYVLEFFFTNCPTICPIMNENMGIIQKEYINNPLFGIASISIDPERDSNEVLKNYAKEKGATMKNWHFLRGDIKDVFELSNKGFKLYAGKNKEVEGGFEHSGLFALIDKDGFIRSRTTLQNGFENPLKYYDGLVLKEINWLKEDIALLLQE